MKQVILLRKDLKMPFGKACAQASHASVHAVLGSDKRKVSEWLDEGGKKVVLGVDSLEELREYHKKALKAKLVASMVKDAGLTFFKKPTITCLAIGPDKDEKIDAITGKLKIL